MIRPKTPPLFRAAAERPADIPAAEQTSAAQRRADALGLLAECALATDLDGGAAGDRYQVVLHVEGDALRREAPSTAGDASQAVLDDGSYVSAETSRRLACDASVVVMRHAMDGSVLDVGRKTRTIPTAIRRALATRDTHCRFPGCTNRRTDAHHLEHWADGGRTRLDNLVLLCRRHHRLVHEGGWSAVWDAEGDVVFARSDGVRLERAPAAPMWRDTSPLAPSTARLAFAAIVIGPTTSRPLWGGERFDVGWAIDVLRQGEGRGQRAQDVSAET